MKEISFLSLALLTGCATIVNGPQQSIGIFSTPENACVWVDKQYMGKTPLTVDMTREDNHVVMIHLDGYYPFELNITKKLSKWVFGNIVFGGFIGVAVDALTGSIYRLTPEQVYADMCVNNVYSAKCDDSYVAIVMTPDPSWEKIGELTPSAQ